MKSKNLLLQKNLALNLKESKSKITLKDFLRQIDLNKNKFKKIEALVSGCFQSVKTGIGFDFNEIRKYVMGDDLRHISWNATAKTGELHTKEYFSEKEFKSFVLIDISNSMFCGNKFDTFIQTTAFTLNLVSGFSEKVGAILFSDEIKYYFPLSFSKTQSNIVFETLLDYYFNLGSKMSESSGRTNIYKALDFTKQYFPKNGVLFLISDFINLQNFEKIFFETANKQNSFLFQIYDDIDYQLPKSGYVSIIDPESKELITVNTDSKVIHESYSKAMLEKQNKLKEFINSIGAYHFVIKSDNAI